MMNFFFSICSLLRNILPDILGVIIGGLITLRITKVSDTNLLKKEHKLEILQNIKSLLREWSTDLLLNVTRNLEISNIDEFKISPNSEELRMLISYFDLNMSVLSDFNEDFRRVRELELWLQNKQDEYKNDLKKVNEEITQDEETYFFENPERLEILENYAEEVHKITGGINKLIVSIDNYISKEILNI